MRSTRSRFLIVYLIPLLFSLALFHGCSDQRGADLKATTDRYRHLPVEKRPKIIDAPEYLLYIPVQLDIGTMHPLIVALSPAADASSMIAGWEQVAEKHKWLLLASKTVRNGVEYSNMFPQLVSTIRSVSSKYPVDKSKIIATGLSGGGMASHYLAYRHPDLIAAVVINTGMMPEEQLGWRKDHPTGKIAVFLASPTDFRYQEMKRDRAFLQSLHWKTHWLEFQGGHIMAPTATLQQAADWLSEEMR